MEKHYWVFVKRTTVMLVAYKVTPYLKHSMDKLFFFKFSFCGPKKKKRERRAYGIIPLSIVLLS